MPPNPPIRYADPGTGPGSPPGLFATRHAQARDDLLAFLLIHTWTLMTGRVLRSDVPPTELSEDELIAFWADDLIAPTESPAFGRGGAAGLLTGRGDGRPVPPDGQVCGLFAVDVAGSTAPGRDDEIQWHVHKSLYEILQDAFDGSGVPWRRCIHEDRGDGVLVVVPPGLAAAALIDPLPERLRALIRRHNRVVREPARIQLRAAAHIGPVHHDGNGLIGSDINLLFRMLEARPVKRMLAESGAELVLTASRYVYDNLIRRHPSLVDPAAFRPVNAVVKGTRIQAWAYVPGPGWPPAP